MGRFKKVEKSKKILTSQVIDICLEIRNSHVRYGESIQYIYSKAVDKATNCTKCSNFCLQKYFFSVKI